MKPGIKGEATKENDQDKLSNSCRASKHPYM